MCAAAFINPPTMSRPSTVQGRFRKVGKGNRAGVSPYVVSSTKSHGPQPTRKVLGPEERREEHSRGRAQQLAEVAGALSRLRCHAPLTMTALRYFSTQPSSAW